MSDNEAPRRYPKGEAKRREILDTALSLIAEQGYRASTLQEIADAVGLTKAGVLHYFDSREALLAAILSERDVAELEGFDESRGDALQLLAEAVSHNATTPGLVALYSRIVVDSAAPEHPAHEYISGRYRSIIDTMADAARARQAAGTLSPDIDPVVFGRIAAAISDGLQLQWSYDKSIDMRETYDAAMSFFERTPPGPPASPAP